MSDDADIRASVPDSEELVVDRTQHLRTASYEAEPGEVKRVLLLYSGGLDTSVMLKWIQERYEAEVVALTVNLGQPGEDYDVVKGKALQLGALDCHVVDAREEFVREFVLPAIKANADYGDGYPLFTSLGRPLIAKLAVEYARKSGCDTIAHGCTGKGNDQVRFDVATHALDPGLEVIAPMRVGMGLTRDQEIDYANERGIEIPITKASPYSIDVNLWGRSCETGVLEDPWVTPPPDAYEWTVAPSDAPAPVELTIEFEGGIPVALDGDRIDRALSFITGWSRGAVQQLIDSGEILVDGAPVAKSHRLVEGSVVEILGSPEVTAPPTADATVEVDVRHEDDDVVVLVKPAGLVVHPGAGHADGTLVNGLLARYPEMAAVGDPMRPGIVHRLDKGTSGLLVVARSDEAHAALQAQVQRREVERVYLALARGRLASRTGTIDAPIGRAARQRHRMAVSGAASRQARTHFTVLELLATHLGRLYAVQAELPVHGDAEQARRQENRDLWVAVTSHELRTPVTVIKGYADTLTNRWESLGDPGRREAVRVIGARAGELARLVDRLLSATSEDGEIGVTPAGPFDLPETLRSAVDELPADLDRYVDSGVRAFLAAYGVNRR